jgi:hypothetical protein
MMKANTLVVVLLSILVALAFAVPAQAASGKGIGIITVANHPPSITNVTITAAANSSLGLSVAIHEPDSLVDVDRVVVHIDSLDQHESLTFEWARKGSRNVPNYCDKVTGCWYELTPGHNWTNTLTIPVVIYHDAISPRTTTGTWYFTFNLAWSSHAGISGSWSFEVYVYDRSGATVMTNSNFQIPST